MNYKLRCQLAEFIILVLENRSNHNFYKGVDDFDLLTKEDPNEIAEYARDIFQYYKTR